MPAEHDEAKGERRGQDQPHRSPEPAPEDGGHYHRDGRQAGAVAVCHGFDDVAHQRFRHQEQHRRPHGHGPAGVHGGRERERGRGAEESADVRHEAHQGGQDSPQDR